MVTSLPELHDCKPACSTSSFQLGATRGAFKALLNADNPKRFPDAFVDRMFDHSDWGLKRAVLKLYRATNDPAGLSQSLGGTLAPHRLPALVLWGDSDPYLPVVHAEQQKDYFDAEVPFPIAVILTR